jgi:hypothetical protein
VRCSHVLVVVDDDDIVEGATDDMPVNDRMDDNDENVDDGTNHREHVLPEGIANVGIVLAREHVLRSNTRWNDDVICSNNNTTNTLVSHLIHTESPSSKVFFLSTEKGITKERNNTTNFVSLLIIMVSVKMGDSEQLFWWQWRLLQTGHHMYCSANGNGINYRAYNFI